jgi:hypothetical protein
MVNERGGAYGTYRGQDRCIQGIGGGNLREKSPLGRPRSRWEDNIKMDIQEMGWGVVDWTDLAQGKDKWRALLNAVINTRVP